MTLYMKIVTWKLFSSYKYKCEVCSNDAKMFYVSILIY